MPVRDPPHCDCHHTAHTEITANLFPMRSSHRGGAKLALRFPLAQKKENEMANISGTYNYRTYRGLDDGVSDTLAGTSSADTIRGYGGRDWIYAGGGDDTIDGGRGNDMIEGGRGMDWMTGGSGDDTYRFKLGDSGPSYASADVITDFQTGHDILQFSMPGLHGTAANTREFAFTGDGTYSGTYNIALEYARQDIGGKVQFAFYTDGHDGYLFADLDHNGIVDTGIELRGLTSTGDFSYLDIR